MSIKSGGRPLPDSLSLTESPGVFGNAAMKNPGDNVDRDRHLRLHTFLGMFDDYKAMVKYESSPLSIASIDVRFR